MTTKRSALRAFGLKPALCAFGMFAGAMPAAAQDTTLTYMLWSPEQVEIEAPAIAAFESAHPGVTVKVQRCRPPIIGRAFRRRPRRAICRM